MTNAAKLRAWRAGQYETTKSRTAAFEEYLARLVAPTLTLVREKRIA